MDAFAAKYNITQYPVSSILALIEAGEIAIPEIQRPFVWEAKQVRDLLDSLYHGYPTGYLIIWQNPNVKLKKGGNAPGKKILIDGQQRVSALMTSIAGLPVLNENYRQRIIKIAFNPVAGPEDERFAVSTPAHENNKKWIPDISRVFKADFANYKFIENYAAANPGADKEAVDRALTRLSCIKAYSFGVIQLNPDLDISEVTEIFVRINAKGARLDQADFAMAKIAADDKYGGNLLRKAVDYFCHLVREPGFYGPMALDDGEFMQSGYAPRIKWVKKDKTGLYVPGYADMLRVAFMHKFGKGRLTDLVSMLSGRDFETRTFKEAVAEKSFALLKEGVLDFITEHHYDEFVNALRRAGFADAKLLSPRMMTLDFAYALYLRLRENGDVPKTEIKGHIQKWFVLSTLTDRYAISPESQFDRDLRDMASKGVSRFSSEIADADLSEAFWNVQLPQRLETSSAASPYFSVYTAAQVFLSDTALFSANIKVSDLLSSGDAHHVFPKEYLKQNGISERSHYNQVANYVYLDTGVNIAIGKRAPSEYFKAAREQAHGGKNSPGKVKSEADFLKSLKANSIPESIMDMSARDYPEFLRERRKRMAEKIRKYYCSL